jgi:uncharacterized protein YjiS (DUF1127 family)
MQASQLTESAMHAIKQFFTRWTLARAARYQHARARTELRTMDLPGLRDLALAPAEIEFWLARSEADRQLIDRS